MTNRVVVSRDRIPVLVNPGGGSADAVLKILRSDSRFAAEEIEPAAVPDRLRALLAAGHRRLGVCGGDGTVAAAASVLAGRDVELAIIPGGTLNHLARDHGVPIDPEAAVENAYSGGVRRIDVAAVNGKEFVNTSAVGAYVSFVMARERFERSLGYRLATLVAAVRMFARLPRFTVHLETEGVAHHYRATLVFIGVGQRALQAPQLGGRVENGKRGLHVIVVRNSGRARLVAFALAALFAGLRTRVDAVDAFLVERCRVEPPAGYRRIATDGEIVDAQAPLEYELRRDALVIVVPASAADPPPAPGA